MNKRVGLAIVTYTVNYGTYLQAFATQTTVRMLGYETKILNIDSVISDVSAARKRYFIRQLLNFAEVKSYAATVKAIINRKVNPRYREYYSHRAACFKKFHDRYFEFGPVCESWDGLSKYCRDFSSILVGSDQLWRPANIAGNFYTLNFVPKEVNKVSYATSFGLNTIRDNQKEIATAFLNRIQHLSCREESGVQIIRNLTGREAQLVCDPTLLLPREEWERYVSPEPIVDGDYILTYLLSDNREHRNYVKKLAAMTHCKVVGILHGSGYVHGDEKNVDVAPKDIGPFEFLNLVKNAKFMCTDSFHGCVFATIFERDFYAFKRFSDKDKMSTNSRVTNLLSRLQLMDRLIDDFSQVNLNAIDYVRVNSLVREFRESSRAYLVQALEDGK